MTKQAKREQILKAAEKLFSQRRFHEITTDGIAREAGVGKGTIYRYFKDKDELFFETAHWGFDDLCERLQRPIPENAGFRERLLQACTQISEFFESRRHIFQTHGDSGRPGFTRDLRHRWMEKRKRLLDAVAGVLRSGRSEGLVRADILPEVMARFLLGMLHARARECLDVPESMRQYGVVVDMFCHGALARPAEKPSAGRRRSPEAAVRVQ